jgi:hypothetical protein
MVGRFVCTGALLSCCWLGQARAASLDAAMAEARDFLAQQTGQGGVDEDRAIALAVHVAGGCPATIDGEVNTKARQDRKQTIDRLITAVAEAGSKRGLTKLLQLLSCGIESPRWGRERILEQAMARMIAFVPCTPPLPGEVAAARGELADFPILRLRKGVLRAELPTPQELDDLAYFLVAVDRAGEEVGARREGGSWRNHAPAHGRRAELFAELAVAKSAGKVLDVERLARSYLETLNFPDALHGAEEDVFFGQAPRYHYVMRDLAESWEALGRFHEAAGLWRRNNREGAACRTGASFAWQEQVKAVIRDEEIEGRCEAAVAERLLDIDGSAWQPDDPYGPKRLRDAGFDLARLLRGALLTRNRDAGEATVLKAIAELPATPRLFAQMRIRDKGVEDWERRLEAARGVADTMQEAAIPLLLPVADESLPAGRQRAIAALGDLAERPQYDPCGGTLGGLVEYTGDWIRPVRPIEERCEHGSTRATRERLAKAIRGYAGDRDVATREAVAVALGKLAVPVARRTLRRLLADPEPSGQSCAASTSEGCQRWRPRYPVREAAREALDNVKEVERNWQAAK